MSGIKNCCHKLNSYGFLQAAKQRLYFFAAKRPFWNSIKNYSYFSSQFSSVMNHFPLLLTQFTGFLTQVAHHPFTNLNYPLL